MKLTRDLSPRDFEIAFQLKVAANALRNYNDVDGALENIGAALIKIYE